ncbi:sulfotransferase [Actinocorallia longicatena]|uniref:Sulfotransferase n=2 Tax=Actinocorallia longicatena TaxID=111803 RepID=A0ABP6PVH4_9ACTN
MLNSHPSLAVPHETRFVVPAWRRRDSFGDLRDPERRRDVARWIIETPSSRSERLGIPAGELIELFAEAPPTLGSLMAAAFSRHAERNGKERWGDKRPHYVKNMNAVLGFFPDARFVNVIRDPRACALSMGRIWENFGDIYSAAEVWERSVLAGEAAARKLEPGRFMTIHYEDLVTKPDDTLDRVCRFLDLDTAHIGKMLDYPEGPGLPTGQIYEKATRAPDPEAMHQWRGRLDGAALGFIEHVLAKPMARHGYLPEGDGRRPEAAMLRDFASLRSTRDWEDRRRDLVELKRRFTHRQPPASLVPGPRPATDDLHHEPGTPSKNR